MKTGQTKVLTEAALIPEVLMIEGGTTVNGGGVVNCSTQRDPILLQPEQC